jgi:hypothetical protein
MKRNTKAPSWSTFSWLMSLHLLDILADELKKDIKNENEADYVKSMTPAQIKEAVAKALPELQTQLAKGHQKLKEQEHVDATALNDNFSATKGSFTFEYGGDGNVSCWS